MSTEEKPAQEAFEYERVEKKSPVWKYIYKLKNGPVANRRGTLCGYVCRLCIEDQKTPFQDALIAIHNDNTSNGTSHLKSHHASVHQTIMASTPLRSLTPSPAGKREKKVARKDMLVPRKLAASMEFSGGFKRILVTGGAGFLGLHLCKRLVGMGHQVICLDNLFTSQKSGLRELLKYENFEFVRHDVINPYYAEVDEIYNLACPASPVHYQYNPIQTAKTSFLGALNMLGLAKRVNAKILQASTSEVYGDPEVSPQPESYAGHVNCVGVRACYDEGKRVAETLFFDYHRMHQIDIRVARIFNTYGPGMHPHDGRVVSNFIMQALANEPITIYGDGDQTRSFCFVDDLVTGLILLMDGDHKGPMNLGNPHEITISTLANTIIRLTNSTSTIVTMDAPNDDPKRRKPDITLASEHLGWQPNVELENGLQQTIDYFRSIDMNYFRKPTPHTAHKSSENDL